jgi:protease-4
MALQPHLINAILHEPWAITPDHVVAFAPLIRDVFNPNLAFERSDPVLPYMAAHAISQEAAAGSAAYPDRKQIRVITISGALTKYDQACGPAGTQTIGGWIREADADPGVDGILLRIDSPGGMVAGTETLAEIIKGTSKPVVAFVDDLAASAGYWLAASADYIIANNSTAQIGSIGVLSSFMDVQPALEKQGVKFHTILAPQSENKTKLFDKVRAGDYEAYKEQVLRPLADKFINHIKSSRPEATELHFKGDVFFAKDLVGSLIDEIGNFQRAVEYTANLAHQNVSSSSQHNNSMSKPEFMRLAKAANVPQLESADGSITLSGEMAEAVETVLEENETAQANLQQQLNARADQQDRITELEGQLQTANNRIAELEKGPGTDSAETIKETDAGAGGGDQDDFWSRYHNLKNL